MASAQIMPRLQAIASQEEELVIQIHRPPPPWHHLRQTSHPLKDPQTRLLLHLNPQKITRIKVPKVD